MQMSMDEAVVVRCETRVQLPPSPPFLTHTSGTADTAGYQRHIAKNTGAHCQVGVGSLVSPTLPARVKIVRTIYTGQLGQKPRAPALSGEGWVRPYLAQW